MGCIICMYLWKLTSHIFLMLVLLFSNRPIRDGKLNENAWLMYFMVCEVNIKWWNKSTVGWTFEIIVPYSQIWLNLLMDNCPCGYIDHKIREKKTPHPFLRKEISKRTTTKQRPQACPYSHGRHWIQCSQFQKDPSLPNCSSNSEVK